MYPLQVVKDSFGNQLWLDYLVYVFIDQLNIPIAHKDISHYFKNP